MFNDDETAAELSRILAQIKAKDQPSDPPPPSKLELRIQQLIENGYTETAASAIATLEIDEEVRNQVIHDVATHMFGGGLKESRSASIVWQK